MTGGDGAGPGGSGSGAPGAGGSGPRAPGSGGSGSGAPGRWSGLREALGRMRAERLAADQPEPALDAPSDAPGSDGPAGTAGAVGASGPVGAVGAAGATDAARGPDPVTAHRSTLLAPFRAGLLGGLGLLIAYALYLSLDTIRGTLVVIAFAAVLAIGLDPVVRFLIRRRMRRGFAVLIVFLGMMAFLFGAFYAIIPPIVTEVSAFIEKLPDFLKNLQHNATVKSLDERFGIIKAIQSTDFIKRIGSGAPTAIFTAAGIAFDVVVVVILTLYFLAGLPRIKAAGYRLVPASRRDRVTDIGDKIIKQMGGYLGGSALIALQAGVVAGSFAAIVGLPYPWAVALAATVLDFVPVVGPVIIGVGMALLGFSQSLALGIVTGIFYVCQHVFEAYWLYPRVMRRTVHVSSAAVIVAILIGGALLGIIGAVLAVPVAAAVQLIVREVVLPRQERT